MTVQDQLNSVITNFNNLLKIIAENFNFLSTTKANNSEVVHIANSETISGSKTFTSTIVGTINNAATATKATQDASGNVITTTYATQTTTGQLTDLETTDKTNLVSAINEVKGAIPSASSLVHTTGNETIDGVKTFTSTIVGTINNATNATNATKATKDANGNVITTTYATQTTTGQLTDLETTNKTNLVAAINEVKNTASSGGSTKIIIRTW